MNTEPGLLEADITIIGGGLVGASLAAALRNTTLDIVVIEPYPAEHAEQPSYNERTVALTWSARQIYTGMGIWPSIARSGIEAIKDIHVSTRGQYGMAHLEARDVGTEALGYVVPTRLLGKVLYEAIEEADNIRVLHGASAESMENESNHNFVRVKHDDKTISVKSNLVVLADGGRSPLGDQFAVVKEPYSQSALLTFVAVDRPHNGRAYERFTAEGPLALLPHSDNRYAVVWTCEAENLQNRLALNDKDFLASLQDTFGDRAGNFTSATARNHYPLERRKLEKPAADRCVVIGNAAHTVHPVAGQGFNLGLRDVAALAESLALSTTTAIDIGDADTLAKYLESRKHDTLMVQRFTHGLIELFSQNQLPAKLARSALLHGVELIPAAKRFLLKRTMGLSGKHSRLAMGLPLDFTARQSRSKSYSE